MGFDKKTSMMRYSCKNTEQLGVLVERAMCDIANIPFNTKRKYDSLPQDIVDDISYTVGPILKRSKLEHAGNLNMSYDFLMDGGKMSVKTIMKGNKICPQNIGQCSLSRLSKKLGQNFSTKYDFKNYFMENRHILLQNYLENCFCCDVTMIYKFDRGCVYMIKRDMSSPICFTKFASFGTSKQLDDWNESNTVYIHRSGGLDDPNRTDKRTLGEIQVHNNRDCVKFRFNMDTLIEMIDSGCVNLTYDVYNLKTKYSFTVESRQRSKMVKLCFPSFNYIGSKMKLLDFIKTSVTDYTGRSYSEIDGFADICSGTGVVAFDVLRDGCKRIMTNDIQHYAYVISSVWSTTNIDVNKIKRIVNRINDEISAITQQTLPPTSTTHFVYNNYTECGDRMYLTKLNGYKTDIIRQKIEEYRQGATGATPTQPTDQTNMLTEKEYHLMLKLLLYAVSSVSNIASVYGAYLKQYKKSALKDLRLNADLVDQLVKDDTGIIDHKSYNKGIVDLLSQDDLSGYEVVYMDPPYVANRSYHDNYHVLETISRYDNPKVKGKTGLRDQVDTKSKFCSKRDALSEFGLVLSMVKSRYICISYSSESIVSKSSMIDLMETCGWKDVKCYEKVYQRFKSNKNSEDKQPRVVTEYIFCGKRN